MTVPVRRFVAEAVGTAVVVTTACVAVGSSSALAPLTAPAVWAALLAAGGAADRFYNPALAAAAWVLGRLRSRDLLVALVGHLVGGLAGGVLGRSAAGAARTADPTADPIPVTAGAWPDGIGGVLPAALVGDLVVAFAVTLVMLTALGARTGPAVPVGLTAAAAAVLASPSVALMGNPAVVVAAVLGGALPAGPGIALVPVQLAGALAAALVVRAASAPLPSRGRPGPATGHATGHATRHVTGVPRPREARVAVPQGS